MNSSSFYRSLECHFLFLPLSRKNVNTIIFPLICCPLCYKIQWTSPNSLACRELLPEPEVRKASCAEVAHPSAVRRWWWTGDAVSETFIAQKLPSLHRQKTKTKILLILVSLFSKWVVQGLDSANVDWEAWPQLIKVAKTYQGEEFRHQSSVKMKLKMYMCKPSHFPNSQAGRAPAVMQVNALTVMAFLLWSLFESRKFSFLLLSGLASTNRTSNLLLKLAC